MRDMITTSSTKRNRRESDEAYSKGVVTLTDRLRIIECRDGIQWIVQKRVSPQTATKAQWRGLNHYRHREDLLTALVRLKIDLTADQQLVLQALPAWLTVIPP